MLLRVRGENHTLDLVTLIIWPDDSQNLSKIWPRFLQSLTVALVKSKMSSAKNRCERRTCPLKEIGWISLFWTASANLIDKRSKQRINRYGESRSPCLKPRLGTTSGKGEPFQRTWNRVEEIMFMMRVRRVGDS